MHRLDGWTNIFYVVFAAYQYIIVFYYCARPQVSTLLVIIIIGNTVQTSNRI